MRTVVAPAIQSPSEAPMGPLSIFLTVAHIGDLTNIPGQLKGDQTKGQLIMGVLGLGGLRPWNSL